MVRYAIYVHYHVSARYQHDFFNEISISLLVFLSGQVRNKELGFQMFIFIETKYMYLCMPVNQ